MIAEFIANYKELTVVGVFSIMMAWYLWYQTKHTTKREDKREERDTKREEKVLNMVDTSLRTIETTTTKNKALNKQIAVIQERTLQAVDAHRLEATEHNKDIVEIIRNTLNLSNGGNPIIKKILERLDKVEKKA